MRKLGKRQLQILQIMSEGRTIFVGGGLRFDAFFSSYIGDEINRIINLDRIFALRDRGLIENVTEEGWHWRGSEYKITEKGLALAAEEKAATATWESLGGIEHEPDQTYGACD